MKTLLNMLRMRRNREAIYTQSSYWDSKARDYTNMSISLWPNEHLNELYHREQLERAYKSLGELSGKEVLDVGCGVGRMTRHLAKSGACVLGIDFSPETIEVARRLSSGDRITYEVLSLYELSHQGKFDTVCITGVLTVACKSREDVREALRRARDAIKTGGELLIIEPLHTGFLHRVLNMDVAAFCELLRDSGFRIQWVRQLHFWPMRFALAFIKWPRGITTPCYHFGQIIMKVPGFRGMGDYKAIKAIAV
jgi:2-polyprenyl-3-methyl-5-hydroxy-6-metoxy-1,4-benzoquinol methylase